MEKRIFTLEEANRLLPALRSPLEKMVDVRSRLKLIEEALEYAQAQPDLEENPEQLHHRLNDLMYQMKDLIRDIQKSGCVIKDIDKGIVDFYHKRDGELVFLCWMLGEEHIQHWHPLYTGFAGREPISFAQVPGK